MPVVPEKPQLQPRPHGTGYVTAVWSKGGWRFKARFPDGAKGVVNAGTFDTEEEAHAALNALLDADRSGCSGSAVLFDYGLARIEKWPDQNKRSWRSTWKTVVGRAPFAQYPVDAVAHPDVRDWALHLPKLISVATKKPISWGTAKHALGLVRRVLADAKGDGLVPSNVALDVRLPKRKSKAITLSTTGALVEHLPILSADDVDKLLTSRRVPLKQTTAFAIAILAGPREGEICALRWEHVDLTSRSPHLTFVSSWETETKSGHARVVPILPRLLPHLRRWWEDQGRPTLGPVFPAGDGGIHHRGYDFGWAHTTGVPGKSRAGEPYPARTRLGWWHLAGVRKEVTFHELRHTCGSHLAAGTFGRRWSKTEIKEFLGHSDEAVTERYVHIAAQVLHEAAAHTTREGEVVRVAGEGISPESVRTIPREVAQVAEIILRAVRDSNSRHLAPEAAASTTISSTYKRADRMQTDRDRPRTDRASELAAELVSRIGSGLPVARDEADELASLVLTSEAVRRAGALADASDPELHAAVLALAQCLPPVARRRSGAAPSSPARSRGTRRD